AGGRDRPLQEVDDLAALGLVAVDRADDEHLARRGRVADADEVDRAPLDGAPEPFDARRGRGLLDGGRRGRGEGDRERRGQEPGQAPHRRSASVVTTASYTPGPYPVSVTRTVPSSRATASRIVGSRSIALATNQKVPTSAPTARSSRESPAAMQSS